MKIHHGDALEFVMLEQRLPDLIATDPPYAFGGSGCEHELSATVAVVLREAARRLNNGRWMLVMCASSWRSTHYMVDAMRGIVEAQRIATWCKPQAKTKARTVGWKWASVNVIAFRKGKALEAPGTCDDLDHILAAPVTAGRRAELPPEVASWVVRPFVVPGSIMWDPFAGSGALLRAAEEAGMDAVGCEINPPSDLTL
jgi:DNA modification methylase